MNDLQIDWRAVVDEAIRRRKSEGLTQRGLAELAGVSVPTVNSFEKGDIRLRFERVVAILDALGLFAGPGEPDSFAAFLHSARRRWEELVSDLPNEHPSRQPLGHSEQAYALEGIEQPGSTARLLEALRTIPWSSGWTPVWVPTRSGIAPEIEDGKVECWLGRADVERHFDDSAHSDFWQVNRQGQAYLQRGYQEDGPGNLDPGTIFDLTLPIWRTAEILLHAARLARLLGGGEESLVTVAIRYTGLEGRELLSWAKPRRRIEFPGRFRTRSSVVDLGLDTDVEKIETELEAVVDELLTPLYERFDGFHLPTDLVFHEISELRLQADRVTKPPSVP